MPKNPSHASVQSPQPTTPRRLNPKSMRIEKLQSPRSARYERRTLARAQVAAVQDKQQQKNMLAAQELMQSLDLLNLVFSGGGAKGAGYMGIIAALMVTKKFDQINEITGTSAGSILTVLVSAGMPALDLIAALNRNLSSFKGKKAGTLINNEEGENGLFSYDAKPLLEFLQQNVYESLVKRLLGTLPVDNPGIHMLPANEILAARKDPAFEAVYMKLQAVKDFKKANITFEDLAVLSGHFPKTFKKPTLIAAKLDKGEPVPLNSVDTPKVEIALAAKASAAIPAYFVPVKIDLKGDGKLTTLIDGGVINNTATQYFQNPSAQTLAFAFEDVENSTGMFEALYSQRWNEVISEFIKDGANPHRKNPLIDLLEAKSLNCAELQKRILSMIEKAIQDRSTKTAIKEKAEKSLGIFATAYMSNPAFKTDFDSKSTAQKLDYLSMMIAKAIEPNFIKDSFFIQQVKKFALEHLADFKPPYTLEEADNEVMRNIYKDYFFQTVLMVPPKGVGTLSFDKATKLYDQATVTLFFDALDHMVNYYIAPKEDEHIQGLYKDVLTHFLEQGRHLVLPPAERAMLNSIEKCMKHDNYAANYQFHLKDYFKMQPDSRLSKIFAKVGMQKIQEIVAQQKPASELSEAVSVKAPAMNCKTQAANQARKLLLKEIQEEQPNPMTSLLLRC